MTSYNITAGKYVLANRTGHNTWWWGDKDAYRFNLSYVDVKEMLAAIQEHALTYNFPDDAVEWYMTIELNTEAQGSVREDTEIEVIPSNFNTNNYAKVTSFERN